MKTRELAIQYAMSKMEDDEWVDYFEIAEWVEQSAIELGIDGSGAKQSVKLFTVDSNTRAKRGKKKWEMNYGIILRLPMYSSATDSSML